jgi:hypothetical protein
LSKVDCIKMLPSLAEHPTTAHIISKYGGTERLQKLILADFFKHGFDGSGSDGGSCIDGRLTSAWNWCSKIEKKVPRLLSILVARRAPALAVCRLALGCLVLGYRAPILLPLQTRCHGASSRQQAFCSMSAPCLSLVCDASRWQSYYPIFMLAGFQGFDGDFR